MNTETENLVLEHPRAIPAEMATLREDVRDLRQRVSSIERHLANIQSDVANIHRRLNHHGDRLARIEHRLELADAPA